MTKRKSAPKRPAIQDTNETRALAVRDLEINQPIHLVRVVGGRLELHLRSGLVHRWPETATERKKRLAAKPKET